MTRSEVWQYCKKHRGKDILLKNAKRGDKGVFCYIRCTYREDGFYHSQWSITVKDVFKQTFEENFWLRTGLSWWQFFEGVKFKVVTKKEIILALL